MNTTKKGHIRGNLCKACVELMMLDLKEITTVQLVFSIYKAIKAFFLLLELEENAMSVEDEITYLI